jgi:hypothetical protein
MDEQLKELIQAREFVPFRVRMNDGSVYSVLSREHAWLGTGRAGVLFVEADSGAASLLQIRSIMAVETEAQAQ